MALEENAIKCAPIWDGVPNVVDALKLYFIRSGCARVRRRVLWGWHKLGRETDVRHGGANAEEE